MTADSKPEKPGKPQAPADAPAANETQSGASPPAAQELQVPMRESRKRRAEAGILAHYEAEEENVQLKETIMALQQDLRASQMEATSLRERMEAQREDHQTVLAGSESRAMSALAERDKAVAECTALRTLFASMKRIWDMVPKEA
jgi:hypothetical protein